MKRYEIRTKETGEVIEFENTITDAIATIEIHELEDLENDEYEDDYYEIYDTIEERVLDYSDFEI